MLYYTFSKGNKIEATYNGRLSFVHVRTAKELTQIEDFKSGNDFLQIWRRRPSSNSDEAMEKLSSILAHEYVHKRTYSNSPCGIALVGWRFNARVVFLLNGDSEVVRRYYKARAIYLTLTKGYHEDLATRLDGIRNSNQGDLKDVYEDLMKTRYSKLILSSERHVWELWEVADVCPLDIEFSLYSVIGRVLHRDYGLVISNYDESGKWTENWISDGGVMNEVKVIRDDESESRKRKKRFANIFRPEPFLGRQTSLTDLKWMSIGIHTQAASLRCLFGYTEQQIERILIQIVEFVIRWAGVDSHQKVLYELFEDASKMQTDTFMQKWSSTIEQLSVNARIHKFINFFYLHGN